MTPPSRPGRRGVGRPQGAADPERVRQRLLEAAASVLEGHGYRRATVRRIAETAGVNPALIHYYFTSKQGLVLALIGEAVEPLLQRLADLEAQPGPGGREGLRAFVQHYTRTMRETPWLPQLLMQEVFEPEGALREPFVRDFASRGGRALRHLFEQARARGEIDPALDPGLAALNVISLALFPFIARGAVESIFGLRLDRAAVDRLAGQITALFYPGPDSAPAPRA